MPNEKPAKYEMHLQFVLNIVWQATRLLTGLSTSELRDLSIPPRRNKEKFQDLMEFERERIIGIREGGFSYHAIGARVQRNSSTVMRVWKQLTDEHRTTQKTGSGRR
ncbi:uncharacterized protein TNCV_723931 [Trichonephila clavipes]|nr:uncharacterized protein TNCV_723931 [Trichonephila clavipes]